MAMVQLCCKIPSREQPHPLTKSFRQNEKGYKYSCNTCTVIASDRVVCNRESFPKQKVVRPLIGLGGSSTMASTEKNMRRVCCAVKSSTSEGQFKMLESDLAKLKDDPIQKSSGSSAEITEFQNRSGEINATKELDYLDAYLGKLKIDAKFYTYDDQTTESNLVAAKFSVTPNSERGFNGKVKGYRDLKDGRRGLEGDLALQLTEETSYLYLISILVSIDIAVFLFEIASPIRNSDFELFSLPFLYGAKINELIVVGEWWRLLTPMFLHSGIFHIALDCWALLTFGPQVCKGYGSFTFFLIFTLGGISGNLTSFLHTSEPTVGGTGPVFAIIGAWLIYQIQNKDVISKDVEERLFQKAILATALSFLISNFGPVDNWTHLGSAVTGIIYGFLTCPILQLGDASSRTSQEERITLVRESANPCRSLAMLTIFLIVVSSLLFVFEPPLDTLALR